MVQEINDQQFEDLIVSKIVEMGCSCAFDLAGQLGEGVKANDLIAVLESLVEKGILRRKKSGADDPRMYGAYQTVYELAR